MPPEELAVDDNIVPVPTDISESVRYFGSEVGPVDYKTEDGDEKLFGQIVDDGELVPFLVEHENSGEGCVLRFLAETV